MKIDKQQSLKWYSRSYRNIMPNTHMKQKKSNTNNCPQRAFWLKSYSQLGKNSGLESV